MRRVRLLPSLLCLFSLPLFAGTWNGVLVDSKCYAVAQGNTNAQETHPASRDSNLILRHCSPTAKTSAFALVLHDGSALMLDHSGNRKASEELSTFGNRSRYPVDITGELIDKSTLKVESMSAVK
jgi:hypothetical protein